MRKDIEISLRDLGGSSFYDVYVGQAHFYIDFNFFKDSKYQVPAELERTVLQYCISFNTMLRTEHHGIHEIRLRIRRKQFCIPTNFSVEHIINRIKLEASSCCSVCCHRDGYGSCKRAEYGQNWSYGDVQECEGFAREQNAYRSRHCPSEFSKWLKIRHDAHSYITDVYSKFLGRDKYQVIWDRRKCEFSEYDEAYDFIVSSLVERENVKALQ